MNMMSELSSEALLQHLASIQLVVNESGIVVDAQVSGPSSTLQPEDIVGHHLPDLVDPSSKETVQAKLEEARRTPGTPIRCDTSVEPRSGNAVPLLCWMCAEGEATDIRVAAIDLLPEASLRHQLLNAQHAMERDYWSKRRLVYRQLIK